MSGKAVQMNRRRRHNDVKISITPMWLDKVLVVLKWSLVMIPLLCVSLAMFLTSGSPLQVEYLTTAVWCLSIMLIINTMNK